MATFDRMRPHVIRQGQYLAQLATELGFDAEQTWQHADNDELRAQRQSPEMLAPGDVIHLPTQPPSGGCTIQLQTVNRYRGSIRTIPLQLRLMVEDEAVANEACIVRGPVPAIELETDGDGHLSFEVPVHLPEVQVEVPARHLSFRVLVGQLDPHDEHSGAYHRLANLGYLPQHTAALGDGLRDGLRQAAISSFQQERGMTPTGQLNEETLAALADVHGS